MRFHDAALMFACAGLLALASCGQGRDAEPEIVFTTLGSHFAPALAVDEGAVVRWSFADGRSSDSTRPSVDYGTAAARRNSLLVTPWSALRRIDIGYDRGDGGASFYLDDNEALGLETVPDQHVSKVENLDLVADTLGQWCSSYNNIQSLDFSGFLNLDTIECYLSSSLVSVNLANLPKLTRACFEDCDLLSLDLSGCPALEDLRGAQNDYETIAFGSGARETLWHICVRDNPQMSDRSLFSDLSRFPAIRELYIWYTNQSGTLRIPSTGSGDVGILAEGNAYSSVDLHGSLMDDNSYAEINLNNNDISSIDIGGCDQITRLLLANNALGLASVDTILATMDGFDRSDDVDWITFAIDLSGNAAPSASGGVHVANLIGKGWNVIVAAE